VDPIGLVPLFIVAATVVVFVRCISSRQRDRSEGIIGGMVALRGLRATRRGLKAPHEVEIAVNDCLIKCVDQDCGVCGLRMPWGAHCLL